MKFLPGDAYIYDTLAGQQVILVRTSDEDRWVALPYSGEREQKWSPTDEIMSHYIRIPDLRGPRTVLIRRGVDILPDAALGYADNIQF